MYTNPQKKFEKESKKVLTTEYGCDNIIERPEKRAYGLCALKSAVASAGKAVKPRIPAGQNRTHRRMNYETSAKLLVMKLLYVQAKPDTRENEL